MTEKLWIYELRTNQHFTLKDDQREMAKPEGVCPKGESARQNTLKRSDLGDFVKCYNPKNRHNRKETERFNKANLDLFWLKDESLEDSANLPPPGVIAAEIVEDLEAALEQFREI